MGITLVYVFDELIRESITIHGSISTLWTKTHFPPTEQTLSFAIDHIPELPIPVDHYCQYLVATFKLGMIE